MFPHPRKQVEAKNSGEESPEHIDGTHPQGPEDGEGAVLNRPLEKKWCVGNQSHLGEEAQGGEKNQPSHQPEAGRCSSKEGNANKNPPDQRDKPVGIREETVEIGEAHVTDGKELNGGVLEERRIRVARWRQKRCCPEQNPAPDRKK